MLDVLAPVAIAPTQIFAPCAPLRIAAGAKDFKRRANPFFPFVLFSPRPFSTSICKPPAVISKGP